MTASPARILLAAACLLAAPPGAFASGNDEEHKPMERTITVTGTGKVSAAPDVADINIGVVNQAATARDALAANRESMNAIHELLKARGVAAKDIQTTQISVQPQYSQPVPPQPGREPEPFTPRIVAYQVTNSVQITARDLDKLGSVLDAVVEAGANQINGISFRIEDDTKLRDVCRKQAMSDARHRAELLAGESGVVVGLPVTINEGGGYAPPRPMFGGEMRMMAAAAPTPVAPGEEELSVHVTVVYELKPAD
jgi:uncharacterized protein YggE